MSYGLRGQRNGSRRYTPLTVAKLLADMEFAPPPPLLAWRDAAHRGMMKSGICLRCWGFADDPRHIYGNLVSAASARYDNAFLVFRLDLPA